MILRHQELTSRVIRSFYDVYNALGYGYLRTVYQNALDMALTQSGLDIRPEYCVRVNFRGRPVGELKLQLLANEHLLVHLICAERIEDKHRHLVVNHLRGTGMDLGLLFNFGPRPSFERVVADWLASRPASRPADAESTVVIGSSAGDPARSAALVHGESTDRVLHEFYAVYNELGFGFDESVYEKALAIVLNESRTPFRTQIPIQIPFMGAMIGDYRADVIVDDKVLLELKAADAISGDHVAQTLNYLKATKIEIGLILNFGPKPTFKRLIFTQ